MRARNITATCTRSCGSGLCLFGRLGEGFRGPAVVWFARRGALDDGHDVDEAGKFVAGDQRSQVVLEILLGWGGLGWVKLKYGGDFLAPARIGDAGDDGVGDGWVGFQRGFDFLGVDFLAAREGPSACTATRSGTASTTCSNRLNSMAGLQVRGRGTA